MCAARVAWRGVLRQLMRERDELQWKVSHLEEEEADLEAELPVLESEVEGMFLALSADLMRLYLEHEYAHEPERAAMVIEAFAMRRTVFVVDGVDEAAVLQPFVEHWILNTLAVRGSRVLCTSRHDGITLEHFASRFVIYSLKPLSMLQQRKARNAHRPNRDLAAYPILLPLLLHHEHAC